VHSRIINREPPPLKLPAPDEEWSTKPDVVKAQSVLDCVRTLGADAVSDYKQGDFVAKIISRAKDDQTILRTAHVVGCFAVDKGRRASQGGACAFVAGVRAYARGYRDRIQFPANRATDILGSSQEMLQYLAQKRAGDRQRCSQSTDRGRLWRAGRLNGALDKVRAGVSGTKLVVTL
jgi:hypothetical protein